MTKDEEILEARRDLHEAHIMVMLYEFKLEDARKEVAKHQRAVDKLFENVL